MADVDIKLSTVDHMPLNHACRIRQYFTLENNH